MKNRLKSDNNFVQILDALDDMVLVKDSASKVVWANKAFCKFYGMNIEQLAGLIDAPHSKPDYTQKYVQDDAWIFANGKTLDIPEETVVRSDGVERIFHTVKSPIFDADGAVEMSVGISRDITDQIELFKSIEAQRAQLVYSSKMATLGEMAGGMAHEINTPLAAIKMMSGQICEILMEEVLDLEQIKKSAERIEMTTSRISKIIDGLRKFSRDGSRDSYVNSSLSKLVDETLSFCRERLINRGIELQILNDGPEIFLDCSSIQLSQVLLNLLNNSIDAVSEIESQKKITIETSLNLNQVQISISDTGPGIEPTLRAKIFDPFFTTKAIGAGTGLGLSISRGIIRSHGGELTLDESSKSAKFLIRMPQKSQK